jgi:hypothetical protein
MEKRHRKWVIWGGLGALGLGLTTFLLSVPYGLERELDAWAKRGVELRNPKPADPVPDAENAAKVYASVFGKKLSPILDPSSFRGTWTTELEEAAREFVRKNPDLYRAMEEGVERPDHWIDRDLEKQPFILFPELAEYRNLCKAMCLRARLRAADGNLSGAGDDVTTALRFVDQTQDLRFGLSNVLTASNRRTVYATVERILSEHPEDSAFRVTARRAIESLSEVPSVRDGLFGDVWTAYLGAKAIQEEPEIMSFMGTATDPNEFRLRAFAVQVPVVAKWQTRIALRELGLLWDQLPEAADQPIQARGALLAYAERIRGLGPLEGTVADLKWIDDLENEAVMYARTVAIHRQILGLIDALDIHEQTGKWPGTLPASGSRSVDPFDPAGGPFRTKIMPDGQFRIYSIGPNGKEERGDGDDASVAHPAMVRKATGSTPSASPKTGS